MAKGSRYCKHCNQEVILGENHSCADNLFAAKLQKQHDAPQRRKNLKKLMKKKQPALYKEIYGDARKGKTNEPKTG